MWDRIPNAWHAGTNERIMISEINHAVTNQNAPV